MTTWNAFLWLALVWMTLGLLMHLLAWSSGIVAAYLRPTERK